MVTGLGTPVPNLLVPDLAAYHGPGTSYSGPKVGPLQEATLYSSGSGSGGTSNASRMSHFRGKHALTATSTGLDDARDPSLTVAAAAGTANGIGTTHDLNGTAPLAAASPATAAGLSIVTPLLSLSQNGPATAFNSVATTGPAGLMPLPPVGVINTPAGQSWALWSAPSFTQVSTNLMPRTGSPQQPARSAARPADNHSRILAAPRTSLVLDSALDELATELSVRGVDGLLDDSALPWADGADTSVLVNPRPQDDPSSESAGSTARLADILLAAGFVGFGAGLVAARKPKAKNLSAKRSVLQFKPRAR
jgi:hypothetical protein